MFLPRIALLFGTGPCCWLFSCHSLKTALSFVYISFDVEASTTYLIDEVSRTAVATKVTSKAEKTAEPEQDMPAGRTRRRRSAAV